MTAGVDVGGTFTDLVWWDGTRLRVGKTPSTADQSEGVESGSRALLGDVVTPLMIHGTTVATNALLQRAGARVALVADRGLEDVLEIGRQDRPSLYDSMADRAAPLVPREQRYGVDGEVPTSLVQSLREADVGAVVVCLLDSYADPRREESLAASLRIALPGVSVVASSEVTAEFREFERFSTATLTAYLGPVVARYLDRLIARVVPILARHLLVMRSSGGLIPAGPAADNAASILLSGPAGGVVAAAAIGSALGHDRVISFDMGGTSTDVCRIEGGRPEISFERVVDGLVCRLPTAAIHTVGAGGGSIGWMDTGGALRVGPRSAGADPGPAAYRRGGVEPAVTDANLMVGRLDPSTELAGSVHLDRMAARGAVARLGDQVGLDPESTALGMIEVVEAHMERAIRTVSVEEGADPRRAVLVAFGGAGGMHAADVARSLDMRGVIVPPFAGVFSAVGLLLSPPRWDGARSVLMTRSDGLDRELDDLVQSVRSGYLDAIGDHPTAVESSIDVRYLGQAHETNVPYRSGDGWSDLADRFHQLHRVRNGFARPDDPIEAVTLRATAHGVPSLSWGELPEHRPVGEARRGHRPVLTRTGVVDAQVWWRPGMDPGQEVTGPAVVEEGEATIWIGPGYRGRLHASGALEVDW